MRFPHWTVTVTVNGHPVRTFTEIATTSDAAINKARFKMRGAVSNAGPFEYEAKPAS